VIIGGAAQSTLGEDIFARKISKIPFLIFAVKINKIPEFYMIFAKNA